IRIGAHQAGLRIPFKCSLFLRWLLATARGCRACLECCKVTAQLAKFDQEARIALGDSIQEVNLRHHDHYGGEEQHTQDADYHPTGGRSVRRRVDKFRLPAAAVLLGVSAVDDEWSAHPLAARDGLEPVCTARCIRDLELIELTNIEVTI